ncbi:hypothetical protein D9M72_463400 [compost metagenome]
MTFLTSGSRIKRSSATGRRKSAVIGSRPVLLTSCRPIEKPKFGMNGNGCAGSIESGVSTGKIDWSNSLASQLLSCADSDAGRTIRMSSLARYCCRTASEACCSICRLSISLRMSSSCSTGVLPSGERMERPWRTCPSRPATRTMKNSSRLAAEIDRKRIRSSSGCAVFSVSSSTRRLNCSQENSRLMKRRGLVSRSMSSTAAWFSFTADTALSMLIRSHCSGCTGYLSLTTVL